MSCDNYERDRRERKESEVEKMHMEKRKYLKESVKYRWKLIEGSGVKKGLR